MTIHDDTRVARPPGLDDTGGMADTLERTTTSTQGGRGPSRVLIVALVIIGLVAASVGLWLATRGGDQPTPPVTATTPTATDTTPSISTREASFIASEKTVRAYTSWLQSPSRGSVPKNLVTPEYLAASTKAEADLKAAGLRTVGQDKLVSITRGDYILVPQLTTTWTACFEAGSRLVDKAGKDVGLDNTGKPIKPGQHLGYTYTVISPDNGTRWVLSKVDWAGKC